MTYKNQMMKLLEKAGVEQDNSVAIIEMFDGVLTESNKRSDELSSANVQLTEALNDSLKARTESYDKTLVEAVSNELLAVKNERDVLVEYTETAVNEIRAEYSDAISQTRQNESINNLVENFMVQLVGLRPDVEADVLSSLSNKLTEAEDKLIAANAKTVLAESQLVQHELDDVFTEMTAGISTFKRDRVEALVEQAGLTTPDEMRTFLTDAIVPDDKKEKPLVEHVSLINQSVLKPNTIRANDEHTSLFG